MENVGHRASDSAPNRIAIVHSFYSSRSPSGENIAVMQHVQVLRNAGYEVELFSQRTDEREHKWTYPLEAAWTVATGLGPKIRLGDFDPDIVHVHNTFPNYGKQWITEMPVPVIASLHNYRLLCSNGLFFRDGKTCTSCLDTRSPIPALVHGCYGNRMKTVPLAVGQRFSGDRLLSGATRIIALSSQMREFYVQSGVPDAKIDTLGNCLPEILDSGPGEGGDYWLYAGRLSAEKGIMQLLNNWPPDERLIVIGTGEQAADAEAAAGVNVDLRGSVSREELMVLMRGARGLVFPSLCYEGFPMVYAEALAAGTPIMTWEPSVMCALVRDDATGYVGKIENISGDIKIASALFLEIRDHCRSVFEQKYTEKSWIKSLQHIYRKATSTRQ